MLDRKAHRLLDLRAAEEDAAMQRETAERSTFKEGPPPEAQLVFSPSAGVAVAVKGARFVVPLPKGYEGHGLELAMIEGERLIATHPNHPPLLIDTQRGQTRPL